MSFLNTIRGLGRSAKKSKKDEPSSSNGYSAPGSPLRRTQSPTKLSPTKQQRIGNQQPFSNNQLSQPQSRSPTRRSHINQSPNRSPQRQQGNAFSRSNQLQQPSLQSQQSIQTNRTQSSQGNQLQQLQQSTQTIQNDGLDEPLPLFLCEPFVKTALVKGSFKTIVQLPKYVDYGEWIALNIFELFNNLNQCYGVIAEYVTPEEYPTMNAGPRTNYLWVDSNGQAVNLPACQYIDYVLTWISNKVNDQSVFPTKSGGAFPPNFLKDCKNISRQMFRIFAHIYHNHFDKFVHLSLEAHWNSFFAHFISLIKEYNLLDRSELEPLLPLIENLEAQGKII